MEENDLFLMEVVVDFIFSRGIVRILGNGTMTATSGHSSGQ